MVLAAGEHPWTVSYRQIASVGAEQVEYHEIGFVLALFFHSPYPHFSS